MRILFDLLLFSCLFPPGSILAPPSPPSDATPVGASSTHPLLLFEGAGHRLGGGGELADSSAAHVMFRRSGNETRASAPDLSSYVMGLNASAGDSGTAAARTYSESWGGSGRGQGTLGAGGSQTAIMRRSFQTIFPPERLLPCIRLHTYMGRCVRVSIDTCVVRLPLCL